MNHYPKEILASEELVQIETAIPNLYASAPQSLPFDPSFDIRAFVLRREQGNLLVYSVTEFESDADITRHYLNHWHEALFVSNRVNAPLFCHESDRKSVAERTKVSGTFSQRHLLDDDFEIIPTPGHTRGATAFLWNSGEHRVLFTSDTICLEKGEWVATVLESSDRASYIKSLELLRELEFNVLVPWVATKGQLYYAITDKSDAQHRIDMILERLRRGEDS